MNSLRGRQLVSSFAIIMASILMLGILLFNYTTNEELEKQREELRELGFNLIGFFSFEDGKFLIESDNKDELKKFLKEKNFDLLTSQGSSAYIQDTSTKIIHWHSLGEDALPNDPRFDNVDQLLTTFPVSVEPGENVIAQLKPEEKGKNPNLLQDESYIVYAYGFHHKPYGQYQLVIARSAEKFLAQNRRTQKYLTYLFIASAFLVLFAQLASSYWVIAPIKDFDEEIKTIEAGNQESIVNSYPDEVVPIQKTINSLLQTEKGQKLRLRNTLDDLAHSLKTQLTGMQAILDKSDETLKNHSSIQGISERVDTMKDIVSYQLRRAVVSYHHSLVTPHTLKPVIQRLKDSMIKVHHQREFDIEIKIENEIKIRMDGDDLMELFGNLMNNACRFCETVVEVNAHQDGGEVVVNVDDDGMGFPDKNPTELLKRGTRADSQTDGQGIGLAVCNEIVKAVGGTIELLVSPQVGARVRVRLPS